MKSKILFAFVLVIAVVFSFVPAGASASKAPEPSEGRIFLYGESHGVTAIMEKEFELWREYYDGGMRHLFVELSYGGAQFLNLWMQADDDKILDEYYADLDGTDAHVPYWKTFYKNIKEHCPETVFHGTDVAHQYETTDARYLYYLRENGLSNSKEYRLTEQNITQAKMFVKRDRDNDGIDAVREKSLINNFIREFDALDGEDVMGIYGSYHTNLENKDVMAAKLYERYGGNLVSESLAHIKDDIDPLRTDEFTINGKKYEAAYYGSEDISAWAKGYKSRKFWRLEDAYEDFKDMPLNDNVLPFDNYPMVCADGQVFIIDYTLVNGKVERQHLRSDGNLFQGQKTTEEFLLE